MSDLIERQAAIDDAKAHDDGTPWSISDVMAMLNHVPSAHPEQRWIPVTERLPEEDNWLGGSSKQFSDQVLVTVVNHDDEDAWADITHTVDGEWMLELPRHCVITAWMPLPEPYMEEGGNK